jgi:hypothetical protein
MEGMNHTGVQYMYRNVTMTPPYISYINKKSFFYSMSIDYQKDMFESVQIVIFVSI